MTVQVFTAAFIIAFIITVFMLLSFLMGLWAAKKLYAIGTDNTQNRTVSLREFLHQGQANSCMVSCSKSEKEQGIKDRIFMENIENYGTDIPQKEI